MIWWIAGYCVVGYAMAWVVYWVDHRTEKGECVFFGVCWPITVAWFAWYYLVPGERR